MSTAIIRRKIRVSGVVQGVGFRPFVHRLATKHGIHGWVRNTSGSVEIDAEGAGEAMETFLVGISREAPALARIASVTAIEADPVGCDRFDILESESGSEVRGVIPSDVATCRDCLCEIADESDRRSAYPFTNCTNCGPRFTIIQRVPYDRANTTMSAFTMCADCAAEYADPTNRRFHAEPTACHVCGPRVWLEIDGERIDSQVLEAAAGLLRDSRIVAIKGLGGFHLACDAYGDDAVRTLRIRKGRAAKPFALMVRDVEEARRLCEVNGCAERLLTSHRRPIVLLQKRPGTGISEQVAPGNRYLGLMLPYTPLHTLLFEHAPSALVMTSANLSEEPLVFTNATARERLAGLADAFLMHDRDIHVPCDDSVVRPSDVSGFGQSVKPRIGHRPKSRNICGEVLIRRARGFVPDAIELPVDVGCVLGVGAEQKNTFCLAWDRTAVPSQHIGDLDTVETFDFYRYAVDHFLALFQKVPDVVAHDMHPDYMSTRYARAPFDKLRTKGEGTPFDRLRTRDGGAMRVVAVQHHHAHIASCLAENMRTERCIGLALDGTGYGTNGTVWGGEILLADLAGFQRVGRFEPVVMPGGEAAIRDPRRMAASYLHAAFGQKSEKIAESLGLGLSGLEQRVLRKQMVSRLGSPLTSSAGRLFDALSAAIGVCRERSYEGQPAVELEMAADGVEDGCYPVSVAPRDGILTLGTVALFGSAVEDALVGTSAGVVAARFHNSLVRMLGDACEAVRANTSLNVVALSGGVFQNMLISNGIRDRLEQSGFEVLIHRLLPPNDACISLGQVVVAACNTEGP